MVLNDSFRTRTRTSNNITEFDRAIRPFDDLRYKYITVGLPAAAG